MRIEKLMLENFRSHTREEFSFDRLNFVVGRNATGKSSVQMAIEFLLTGKCSATGGGGRGAEDLIRLGAKDFKIAAQINLTNAERMGKMVPTSLTRCKSAHSHTFAINGGMIPVDQAEAGIRNLLGVSGEVLSAVLDADRFVEMSEAEQKRILASVLDVQPATLPAEIVKDMQALGFVNVPATMARVTEVDQMHAHFFALRTSVKRTLKDLGELTRPEAPADMPDSKLVWKRLQSLRDDLTALTTRRDGRVRDYQNLLVRRTELAEQIDEDAAEAQRKIGNWAKENGEGRHMVELQITETAKAILTSAEERRLMETEGRAGEVESIQREIHKLDAQIAERQQCIDELVAMDSEKCPTCHRALNLKTRGEIQSNMAQMQDSLVRDRDKLRAVLEKLGDPDAAKQKLNVHRAAMLARTRLQAELRALESQTGPELADLEKRIAAAKKKLETLPAMEEPNTGDLDSEMAVLVERIANGEATLDRVKSIEAGQAAWKQWVAQRERREREVEALDRLCDYFGPNGVKARMVGDRVGPFTALMNHELALFGYFAEFTMEPYQFSVAENRLAGARLRSLRMLSESERFRFGVAFQIALAMATGPRFVVIDRADVLDGEARHTLTQMLIDSELDQAIVLSTSDAQLPPKEVLPEGVKFIALGQEEAVIA